MAGMLQAPVGLWLGGLHPQTHFLLLIDIYLIMKDNREHCRRYSAIRKKGSLQIVAGIAPPNLKKPRSHFDMRNGRAIPSPQGGGSPLRGAAKVLNRPPMDPVPVAMVHLRSRKRWEREMSDEKRFGKCDECGVIGALLAVDLAEEDAVAHFCVSCQRVFGLHPELSSFIAFQLSKAPGELIERIEIPLSCGSGRGEDPESGGEADILTDGPGEHRNLYGIQKRGTKGRDDE